jgi:hypothetical protein
MSRDNVSSEQNKASIEWEAYDEWERWNEIKENLSRTYGKADKEGRFERFEEDKLEIIPWEETAKKVASHDESIIRDILSNYII